MFYLFDGPAWSMGFPSVVVQSPSRVRLFVNPWTAALQALLSSTVSQGFLRFMSFELMAISTIAPSAAPFSFCLQSKLHN